MAIKIVPMCLCAYVLMSLITPLQAKELKWKKIDKGFYYTRLDKIHVFQIDLQRFRLSVATAPEFNQPIATVKELAQNSKAILGINGGFFSPEQKSIGLLMRSGKKLNPLHLTPWWAVFYVLEQKAAIVPPKAFQNDSKIEMALQVGPRLVINNRLAPLKPSLARRSGIGIRSDGKILMAITENVELPIQEFAKLFQQLGCENALNLDGGGSSQLYIHWKGFHLDLPGLSLITNAITVLPR